MNATLLKIYHRLPPPARSGAASWRGLRLRSWRYGPETERLVEEALEREHWSSDQWESWQQERLAYVLHRAATKVPFYREQWIERRRRGDQASWESLENWPVLKKDSLRENPSAFIADDCEARRMLHEHTSGTSGKPVSLWQSRQTTRAWYALFEARWRRWYGLTRHDRWAILGGQLVAPFDQTRPPFWVWNAGLRQLYMSSYHLAPAYTHAYMDAIRRHRVTYLLGYASSMYALAQTALEKGIETPTLRIAISNAEPLYEYQRETIARAFRCPVVDTYGMSEIACAASECEAGVMHLWPEAGRIEVLADDAVERSVPQGQTGRFVCTGLLNADMPLVRYEVGDRGALAPRREGSCACGRTLPVLQKVEGRLDDVVLTREGRRVGRLDPVFKSDLPIREAQIIQESLDLIRVRLVPAEGYTDRDGASIARRLQDRLGRMEIVLEEVEQIPRSANGKFRAVVSNVTAEKNQTSRETDSHLATAGERC